METGLIFYCFNYLLKFFRDIDPYEFISGFQQKLEFDKKSLRDAFAFFAKGSLPGFIKISILKDVLTHYADTVISPERRLLYMLNLFYF
jgi:hypothetical protein